MISIKSDPLAVAITKPGDDQRLLAREPLQNSDHVGIRGVTWLTGVRSGNVGTNLGNLQFQIRGGPNLNADRLDGVRVEVSDNGQSYSQHFTKQSLSAAAVRAAVPLFKSGILKNDDEFEYHIVVLPRPTLENARQPAVGPHIRERHEPVVVEEMSLQHLLENSEPLEGALAEQDPPKKPSFPIFVAPDVWVQSRHIARRGGENESAGIVTGRVVRDTESPEIAVLLAACIEAKHATEEKYAVTMTGDDWADFHNFLAQRRRRVNPTEVMVGSVHGHNFAPAAEDVTGNRMCEACASARFCGRTTAAASLADSHWHQVVFSEYPWATLLIWGLNAREEDDWRLYGLDDNGKLAPRALRLLKDNDVIRP